jgi:hypothetical protein
MNPHTHRRLTAWLGMIAISLIVLMPVASQLIVAARINNPLTQVCTAEMPSSSTGHEHGASMSACGYCDLLAHQSVLPTLAAPLSILVLIVAIAALPVLSVRFTPLGAFPSGRPRAPPAFSRS